MAAGQDVLGVQIVRAEAEAVRIGLGDHGQHPLKASGSRALAHKDVHAGPDVFLQNFAVRLLVVIAYAQGRIGLQGPTFQARTVAVQNMARGPGSLHLGQQIPVSCQDARHVHDFAKGTDAILCPQVRQGPGVQHGARVLEGRAGHAGRQGNVDAHRQIPACVQHVAYACHAADIGYLVGIRHHFRGTAGEHGPGKVLRGEHGGLYVQMGIHETGHRGRFLQSTTSRASGAGQSANGRTARMCPSPTSTVLSSRTSRPKTSTTRMHKGQIAGDLPKTHGFSPAQCLTVPVHAAFLPEFLSRALPAVCLRQGPGLCPCVPNGFSQAFPRDRFSEALRDNTKMQDSRPTLAQEPVCRKACIPPFFSV